MGAFMALVIGYVLGTRAGDKGWAELRDSWQTIRTSEGLASMLAGMYALVGEFVLRGRNVLAEKALVAESSETRALRRAA